MQLSIADMYELSRILRGGQIRRSRSPLRSKQNSFFSFFLCFIYVLDPERCRHTHHAVGVADLSEILEMYVTYLVDSNYQIWACVSNLDTRRTDRLRSKRIMHNNF
jgi:hypothetical protein